MTLSRRMFLHSGLMTGAALAVAPRVLAEPTLPGWHVGYANAPSEGFAPAEMKLVLRTVLARRDVRAGGTVELPRRRSGAD